MCRPCHLHATDHLLAVHRTAGVHSLAVVRSEEQVAAHATAQWNEGVPEHMDARTVVGNQAIERHADNHGQDAHQQGLTGGTRERRLSQKRKRAIDAMIAECLCKRVSAVDNVTSKHDEGHTNQAHQSLSMSR